MEEIVYFEPEPSQRIPMRIFDGISFFHAGRRFGQHFGGSFNLSEDQVGASERINNLLRLAGQNSPAFVLKPGFTNRVINTMEDRRTLTPGIDRNLKPADGVVSKMEEKKVVCVANADCYIGILTHKPSGQWAVLHLGTKCLVPQDDSSNIIEEAIVKMDLNSSGVRQISAWFGAGAGECCYGLPPDDSYCQKVLSRFPNEKLLVRKGPRKRSLAISNRSLAIRSARDLGIKEIIVDTVCTSCAGVEGVSDEMGNYFSHLRDAEGEKGRNLFLAFPS